MLAQYILWPCVCLCLSQVDVLLKWLNVGSRKERHILYILRRFHVFMTGADRNQVWYVGWL